MVFEIGYQKRREAILEKIASSAKSVGENRWLRAAKRREPLESCPQRADSRMGL
jgi:hypothetical protein